MPSLEIYRRESDHSYAPGLYPSMEALTKRPESVRRILLHSKLAPSTGVDMLLELCQLHHVRTETADKALARVSGKENCFVAAVFDKVQGTLNPQNNHLVLHCPSDKGNLGTILRTALGFGFLDIAIIRPAADYFDPHVVRASMGALFSLHIREYDDFETYRCAFPANTLYPFMLKGALPISEAVKQKSHPYSLVMGNEGSGLPENFAELGQSVRIPHSPDIDSLNLSIAAGIGMFAFSNSSQTGL